MKLGYFRTEGDKRRPYVEAVLYFPQIGNEPVRVQFLVDTGADRTTLSPLEGALLRQRYGFDLLSLRLGSSTGVGGSMVTRLIDATVTIDGFSVDQEIAIFEPPPGSMPEMPSLLGRDIIYEFGFHLSERRDRVLFLDDDEEDALDLPD